MPKKRGCVMKLMARALRAAGVISDAALEGVLRREAMEIDAAHRVRAIQKALRKAEYAGDKREIKRLRRDLVFWTRMLKKQ